jgi:hypothetical protein
MESLNTTSSEQVRRERRAGPRVAFTARVTLQFTTGEVQLGASVDIGLGGVCLQLTKPVELATIRGVRIDTGHARLSLAARGSWQRVDPQRGTALLGIQFLDLGEEEISTLWSLLHQRALDLTRFLVERSGLGPIDIDVAMDLTLRTRRKEVEANRVIYRAGSDVIEEASIFIVAQGTVSLQVARADGTRAEIDVVEPGGVFGGIPMIIGVPHVDSAVAKTPVQLLEIDRYSLKDLVAEKPLAGRALERAVIKRYVLLASRSGDR